MKYRQEHSPILDQMQKGHFMRKGHKLIAHLESDDGVIWHIVRDCCN